MTASEIKSMLDKKYSINGASLIAFEVNEGTGSEMGRIADAISMTLQPHLGYKISGFEIKTSQGDWRNEVNAPEKSHAISRFCDYWYLVCPQGVINLEQVPKDWGVIEASSGGLRIKVKAVQREKVGFTPSFAASFIRSLLKKYTDVNLLENIKNSETERLEKIIYTKYENKISGLMDKLKKRDDLIERFKTETGYTLGEYSFEGCRNIVKTITNYNNMDIFRSNLESENKIWLERVKTNEKAIKEIEKLTNSASLG